MYPDVFLGVVHKIKLAAYLIGLGMRGLFVKVYETSLPEFTMGLSLFLIYNL